MSDNHRPMAFRRKYSDAQNAAVVDAVLVDGLHPQEVERLAAAGELREGLEAFTMPWRTVQDKAGDARREQATRDLAAADGDAALGAIGARIVATLDREVARLERSQRHGRAEPAEIAAAAKAVREVGAMRRELERAKPRAARGGKPEPDSSPERDDWLAGVAAAE